MLQQVTSNEETIASVLNFTCTMKLTKGKMKAYSLSVFLISTCCIYRYTSVEIKPELKKNILKFGYGINYKYEEMLVHSNGFYVITKFILPTVKDLTFSTLNFDDKFEYYKKLKDNILQKNNIFEM